MSTKNKYLSTFILGTVIVFLLIHIVSITPKKNKQTVSPLATTLKNTNNYLLENNVPLKSEVVFEGKAQLNFAGTQLSANIYNDNQGSNFSYESKVPFETIRYIMNQLSPIMSENSLDGFVIFKDSNHWKLNSKGNTIGENLSFDSNIAIPFLKGNKQYLENKTNLSHLSSNLISLNETSLKENILSPNMRNNREKGFHIQIPIATYIDKRVSTSMGLNDTDVSFIMDEKSKIIRHVEFRVPITKLSTLSNYNSTISGAGNIYLTYDLGRNN